MCVGIYMAASEDHVQRSTHAHILLVGFVVSFLYGLIHRLWLGAEHRAVAEVQFYLHQVSSLAMIAGLLLLYGGETAPFVEPMLAVSSLGVLGGVILMVYPVARPAPATAPPALD